MNPAPPVTSAFPGRRDSAMAASLAPASVGILRTPACVLPALTLGPRDGALKLLLGHARAALDLQALGLGVELLLRPRRAAGGAPRRGRTRPRLRCRSRLRGRP